MWQFVGPTGEQYGLEQSHWVDERRDPLRATAAAAAYLEHLHRRLGNWELALAAYNMGYGALLRAVRKYNTNDYWRLSRVEAGLPFETTVYVAKILACAVVFRNPERFGLAEVEQAPTIELRTVDVPGGVSLGRLARVGEVDRDALAALNPELLRGRTPPGVDHYDLRIPAESVAAFAQAARRLRPAEEGYQPYVVRFGESLGEIARRYRTTEENLRSMNEVGDSEEVGPGLALLVPAVTPRRRGADEDRPLVAVPEGDWHYSDRRRVFYRSSAGDSLEAIARFFEVSLDELRTWNHLDATATLPSGLLLQLFVPTTVNLDEAVVLTPDEVTLLVVGSEEFFDYHERQKGRVRVRYRVQEGDTLGSIADRFGLEIGDLTRINNLARRDLLRVDQDIIVYCAPERAPEPPETTVAQTEE
jgi:membrane-bound lytic murein transglycosylase D